MKLIDVPGLLLWIGRRRNTPITYDDLVNAEDRCFKAEENALGGLAAAAEEMQVVTDGADRLYRVLAVIDTRDGTPLAEVVRTAREGWERTALGEAGAFDDFDACWGSLTAAQRNELALSHLDLIRKWEGELSIRVDKAGPASAAALYARGVLRGLGALEGSEAP